MSCSRPLLAVVLSAWLASPAWSNQAAILQIRILEGEGAVLPAGSRSSRPFTVQITDETGKPVEGAAVSFQLPDDGPSGTFTNGLRTELVVSDANGRASVRGMRWNRTPGPMQVRITASKSQVRAGTFASAYVSDTAAGAGSSHKWIIAGVVAGAAAGGLAYSLSRRNGTGTGGQPPVIGTPTITIGAP